MELQEAIYKRRSIRKFKDQRVSDQDIKALLQLAMAAPSARNSQPWEFYVITSESILNEFYQNFNSMKYKAPLAIMVSANKKKCLSGDAETYWIQDCSAAIENILLGAVDLHLGAVWCGITPQQGKILKACEIMNLDSDIVPLALIYIGYPDENKEERTQYDETKIHYIK